MFVGVPALAGEADNASTLKAVAVAVSSQARQRLRPAVIETLFAIELPR
jgi:hypothetical protein